jgi:Sortase domain
LSAERPGRHRKTRGDRFIRSGLSARLGWTGLAAGGTAAAVLVAAPLAWVLRSDTPIPTLGVSEPQVASAAGRVAGAGDREAVSAKVARPAPSQVVPQRPRSIRLPSGTTMVVKRAATGRDGELLLPRNVNRAGWWDGASRLGDPYGSVVIAAHVDSWTQGTGPFVEILSLHVGSIVKVQSADLRETFRVTSAGLVPKPSLNARSYAYSSHGPSRLVLITCGGPWDAVHSYHDNMVVVATPISGPRSLKRS